MKRHLKTKLTTTLSIFVLLALLIAQFPLAVLASPTESNGLVAHEDLANNGTEKPDNWGALPSPNQLQYQHDELAAFCHFGMNTFTYVEWGSGNERPEQFNLQKDFDAEHYVKTLYDAGYKKLIVTAKHHDGFCIWPSAYTDHSVKNSPYKNGEGDILAELSAACTKYDIDMGLYMSPWDANAESYGYYDENGNPTTPENDHLDYNEFYKNQITEIASNNKYGNNGRFIEWWMDGAKGSGADDQHYEFEDWFDTIQKYQGKAAGYEDDCLLFGAQAYTTVRWIGNELGFADEETWSKSKVNYENNSINSNRVGSYTRGFPDGNQWTVPESDARITPGWFWAPGAKANPKTMEQLSEMYFRSVGHNSPLLLNIPPNDQGTLDVAITDRTLEFGEEIRRLYENNFAATTGAKLYASAVRGNDISYSPNNLVDENHETYWTLDDGETTGSVVIDLGQRRMFDVVSIQEHIASGQRIAGYKVEYKDGESAWKLMEEGTTIGGRRLVRTAPVRGDKVRITITDSHDTPVLSEIGIYKAGEGFELSSGIPADFEFIDNKDFATTGSWTHGSTGIDQSNMWAHKNATASFDFTGNQFWVIANIDPGHGIMKVLVDGTEIDTIDTYAPSRRVSHIVYESPLLENGPHSVTLEVTGTKNPASGGTAIDLDGALYIDNDDAGVFEIETKDYSVIAGDTIDFVIKRVGGTKGEVTVDVNDNPGGAVQGQYYEPLSETLTFAEGETEKTVSINTFINSEQTGDLDFYLELLSPTGGALLGFNSYTRITLQHVATPIKAPLEEAAKLKREHYLDTGWEAFVTARNKAQTIYDALLADPQSHTKEEIDAAAQALEDTMAALEPFAGYTAESPFVFPNEMDKTVTLEGEHFVLEQRVPDEAPNSTNKNVRLSENAGASNGLEVNWFEDGNKIRLHYDVESAGIYEFTATYRSGRQASKPNTFDWQGDNVTPGFLDVHGPESGTFRTATFDVEIFASGPGELVFDATSKAGPVIDKFEIKRKEVTGATHTIGATTDEGGSISPTGDVTVGDGYSQRFTITPDDGYQIKDVLVDDVSVGTVDTYLFADITENHTIHATFDFAYHTPSNPFVMPETPDTPKDVEAEHFELYPVKVGDYVRLSKHNNASGGVEVNWFEEGNVIKLPYTVTEAGTYTVDAVYRSGRIEGANKPNVINWSGENITPGSKDVYGESGATTHHTATFEVEILEAGASEFVLTADSNAGPVLDKFTFTLKAPVVADKTALIALIDEVEALDENDYKADGWSYLETILSEAKTIRDMTDATQELVDTAVTQLTTARDSLELKDPTPGVDKTALIALIDEVEALDQNDYTPGSWSNLNISLIIARNVRNDANADQARVDTVRRNLANARDALVLKDPGTSVDKTKLNALIAEVEALDGNDYTASSWGSLQTILTQARSVANNPSATQADVDNAHTALKLMKDSLKLKDPTPSVDKTALIALIDEVEALDENDYTSDSWSDLQSVLTTTKNVSADSQATQAQVDNALNNLQAKKDDLTLIDQSADKSELKSLIDSVKALKQDDFTPESWNTLLDALAYAKAVYADDTATQVDVDIEVFALQAAKDSLVEKPGVTPEPKPEPETPDKEQLESLISSADSLPAETYTNDSWNHLQEVLRETKAIYADDNATDAEIFSAIDALSQALNNLVSVDAPSRPTTPQKSRPSGPPVGASHGRVDSSPALKARETVKEKKKTEETVTVKEKELTLKEAETVFKNTLKELDPETGKSTLTLGFNNYTTISKEVLSQLATLSKDNNVALVLRFDQVKDDEVLSRITLSPLKDSLDILVGTDLSLKEQIKALFTKYFQNNINVICTMETGALDATLSMKLDKDLATDDLVVYRYNLEENTYAAFDTEIQVDSNGYVHFDVLEGGNYVISDGKLLRR